MSAVSTFGQEQRAAFTTASRSARELANAVRNTDTQIDRLTALAAQYDQDVKKLRFANEARSLFDPLLVAVCPWCQQRTETTAPLAGTCGFCHQALDAEPVAEFNIDRELCATKLRQKELGELLRELHDDLADQVVRRDASELEAPRRQEALDAIMAGRFAPFLDQRDLVVGQLAGRQEEVRDVRRQLQMIEGAERRRVELGLLRQQVFELTAKQEAARAATTSRADVVAALTARFETLLTSFRFPKLREPFLDRRFVPHVRNLSYDQLGSAGAGTLVTLAWHLAILEESAVTGGRHPGLLLIDGPQKGLRPGVSPSDEFQSPSIAASVYEELVRWCSSDPGKDTQVIVVDNEPPDVAAASIIVTYSGDPQRPPYGLIDDAVDC